MIVILEELAHVKLITWIFGGLTLFFLLSFPIFLPLLTYLKDLNPLLTASKLILFENNFPLRWHILNYFRRNLKFIQLSRVLHYALLGGIVWRLRRFRMGLFLNSNSLKTFKRFICWFAELFLWDHFCGVFGNTRGSILLIKFIIWLKSNWRLLRNNELLIINFISPLLIVKRALILIWLNFISAIFQLTDDNISLVYDAGMILT